MLARARRPHPFATADARRLAVLFGVVYFAQGMWYLPNQAITVVFKDRGLSAGQVATFFAIATAPWLIKPVYGLLSDFAPLFGRRRQSYLLLTSCLAAAAGLLIAGGAARDYAGLVALVMLMGLGLAFTDVLVDALMVEEGKPRGLTGALQSVQWGAIYGASVVVGVMGGWFAERRDLRSAFGVAAGFALVTFAMATVVREAPARATRATAAATAAAVRAALLGRDVWLVAGFIFFFTFSPSFGPALLYYQTDVLGFSQQLIGNLSALNALASVAGAFVYAALSRRAALRSLIHAAIAIAVAGTAAYLAYRGFWSAVAIEVAFGCAGMITQLAFLDLAAKACPARVEATFFALLMSVYNAGQQLSEVLGGHLYDRVGFSPLVLISAGVTALTWLLVPLVPIERIEARAAGDVPR